MREGSYRRGWRKVLALSCPVISVGNLTVGGTGKSTLCLEVASRLERLGLNIALVTHAHLSRPGRRGGPYALRGAGGPLPPWSELGDEAAMMLRADPELLVVGGPDKSASFLKAGESGADVVVIDDGFHRRDLRRDLDLVTFDGSFGLGNGRCLPRGPLREPPQALARADAFVLTIGASEKPPRELAATLEKLNPAAPLIMARKVPRGLEAWRPAGREEAPADPRGVRLWAFCALGNPASFLRSLDESGAVTLGRTLFEDHHAYRPAELEGIARSAREAGARVVVTSAKDAVKVGDWPADAPPLAVLMTSLALEDPGGWLEGRLRRLAAGVRKG